MKAGEKLYFSPRCRFLDLKWNDKKNLIYAFIDRVRGFYLKPAEKLNKDKNGFATGILCVATVDFLAKIVLDNVQSRISKWLVDNVREFCEVDPDNPRQTLADRFYKEFRNGLIHEGRIKNAGQFSYDPEGLVKVEEEIMIVNPDLLLKAIKMSFRKYIDQVKGEEGAFRKFKNALKENFKEDIELAKKS